MRTEGLPDRVIHPSNSGHRISAAPWSPETARRPCRTFRDQRAVALLAGQNRRASLPIRERHCSPKIVCSEQWGINRRRLYKIRRALRWLFRGGRRRRRSAIGDRVFSSPGGIRCNRTERNTAHHRFVGGFLHPGSGHFPIAMSNSTDPSLHLIGSIGVAIPVALSPRWSERTATTRTSPTARSRGAASMQSPAWDVGASQS